MKNFFLRFRVQYFVLIAGMFFGTIHAQGTDPFALSGVMFDLMSEDPHRQFTRASFEGEFTGHAGRNYECEFFATAGGFEFETTNGSTRMPATAKSSGGNQFVCSIDAQVVDDSAGDVKLIIYDSGVQKVEILLTDTFQGVDVVDFADITFVEKIGNVATFRAEFGKYDATPTCGWEWKLKGGSAYTALTSKPVNVVNGTFTEFYCDVDLTVDPAAGSEYVLRFTYTEAPQSEQIEEEYVLNGPVIAVSMVTTHSIEVNTPLELKPSIAGVPDAEKSSTNIVWTVPSDTAQNKTQPAADPLMITFAAAGDFVVDGVWTRTSGETFPFTTTVTVADSNANANAGNGSDSTGTSAGMSANGHVETDQNDPGRNCDGEDKGTENCWKDGDAYTGPKPQVVSSGQCVTHVDEKLPFFDKDGDERFRPIPPKRSTDRNDYWGCFCYEPEGKSAEWYTTIFEEVVLPGQSDVKKYAYAQQVKYCVQLDEAIGDSTALTGETGAELYGNYIQLIYRYAAMIIGIVVVFVIVVSGIQIITGGASPSGVEAAKERIFQSILSMVLLFGASAILQTVNPTFFKVDIDSDNDTMPDHWEVRYGLNKFDPTDGDTDLDKDDVLAKDEYQNSLKRSDDCAFKYRDPTIDEDLIYDASAESCPA